MTLTPLLLMLLGLVSSTTACRGPGMFPHRYESALVDGYVLGAETIGAAASYLITTANTFNLFGKTGDDLMCFSNGVCRFGTDNTILEPAAFTLGATADDGFLAALWYTSVDLDVSSKFEVKHLLRASEYEFISTSPATYTGAELCTYSQAEDALRLKKDEPVVELLLVTWEFVDATDTAIVTHAQLVVARTSDDNMYSIMFHEADPWGTYEQFVANGEYIAGSPEFATVCDVGTDITEFSNYYCGYKGSIVYSLNAGDECTDKDVCASLEEDDVLENDQNCRKLLTPADTCEISGSCLYATDAKEKVNFEFVFSERLAMFDSFEATNNFGERIDDLCILSSTPKDNYVSISKTWDADGIGECAQGYDAGTGIYTFYVRHFHSTDGNAIEKDGMFLAAIECKPAQFVSDLTAEFGVENIIRVSNRLDPDDAPSYSAPHLDPNRLQRNDEDATTVPTPTPRTCTFTITNGLNYLEVKYSEYEAGNKVDIGAPLYLKICFEPGSPYHPNASPYAVHAINCYAANTADFLDMTKQLLEDGCPVKTPNHAFETAIQFITFNGPGDSEYCITTGVIPAAKWRLYDDVYFKCSLGLCYNTGYFQDSKCRQSCKGKGVDTEDDARKRRDADIEDERRDDRIVVTAHLKVSDKFVDDSSKSCADETLAYTAIAVLIVFLLVATAIAVLLFMRLLSIRRRK